MEYFCTEKPGKVWVLRLDQGDMLLESIREMVGREKIEDGVVVSGIGTLDRCVMHMVTTIGYPPQEYFQVLEDTPMELASLQGVIADGVPHLHMVVGDTKSACAGHLEPGCRILYLGEVVIQELPGFNLHRVPNDRNISRLVKKQSQRQRDRA